MPNLYIYPKKDESFTFPLQQKKISIGRSADNDIAILDPYSSGHHSLIYPKDNHYVVRDNNSKNGTFLNGKKIQSEIILNKGDEVLVGSTRIVFDQEISTHVEVTDTPSSSATINSMIQIEDILKNRDISTTIKAKVRPMDMDMMRIEHQISSVISEVSKALVLHRPLNELLEHILDLIGQHMGMDRGILMLKEGNPPQFIPRVIRINNPRLENQKIQDVAVIGIPDERWGEAVHAIVVLQRGYKKGENVTEEELIAHVKDQIARYKAPKSIKFKRDLPKSAQGKILKKNLRKKHWEGHERRVA